MKDDESSGYRFIADEMLGKLARWLRAIGYDTVYYEGGSDDALMQQALEEDRIILTRDSDFLEKKLARKIFFLKSEQPREQFRQIVEELGLDVEDKVFTRCIVCNKKLIPVDKNEVQDEIPVYIYLTQNKFYYCLNCGKVYWPGTHKDSMLEFINSIIT
jgi:hypothetical protein